MQLKKMFYNVVRNASHYESKMILHIIYEIPHLKEENKNPHFLFFNIPFPFLTKEDYFIQGQSSTSK
jgi:hypothetical protein